MVIGPRYIFSVVWADPRSVFANLNATLHCLAALSQGGIVIRNLFGFGFDHREENVGAASRHCEGAGRRMVRMLRFTWMLVLLVVWPHLGLAGRVKRLVGGSRAR